MIPATGSTWLHPSPRTSDFQLLNRSSGIKRRLLLPPLAASYNYSTQATEGGSKQGTNFSRRQAVIKEINTRVRRLGAVAVLPGNQAEKDLIDEDLRLLEALQQEDDTQGSGSSMEAPYARSRPSILNDPRLLGSWDLLYASNGTAVTRASPVQALVAASQLPGVGVADIKQCLSTDQEGCIQASNEAEFGLGPFGTWRVAILGKWLPGGSFLGEGEAQSGQVVKVVFERLKIKPVGMMGVPLPNWLPEALLSLGAASVERGGAEWFTTFLDDEFRIGRGRTGNTFFFRKRL
mmetsp:Transcript_22758/g.62885  ORF Transcript_22758/g.62885 Transcript_22758/m.62885 type:complete len:292 (-) Transcript_22758:888-1763(-)